MAGSITVYLRDLRNAAGEPQREQARRELWRRAYDYLVGLAQKVVAREDAEEVASDSLGTFFSRAEAGALPRLDSRQDFWALLSTSTRNRALNRSRDNRTARRGGGWSRMPADAIDQQPAPQAGAAGVDDPEEMWTFLEFLVELGNDPELRDIAYLKYCEGREPAFICQELGISQATFYRKHARMLNAVELFEQKLRQAEAP
jgi:RNA polymerase sigma factor (sigma-70 family)